MVRAVVLVALLASGCRTPIGAPAPPAGPVAGSVESPIAEPAAVPAAEPSVAPAARPFDKPFEADTIKAVTKKVPGEYRHEPSGAVFPSQIGRFQKQKVHRYDEAGRDVSVGYNLSMGGAPLVATVYVFPAPRFTVKDSSDETRITMKAILAEARWKKSVAAILRGHEGATLDGDEEIELVNHERTYRGRMATFHFANDFGGVTMEAQSRLYSFCWAGEDWVVEYRFTWPAWFTGTAPLDELLRAVRWP